MNLLIPLLNSSYMNYFVDYCLQSYNSNTTSKHLSIESLNHLAKRKDINVIGSSFFTHPASLPVLEEKFEL